jgi:hypothetical protein
LEPVTVAITFAIAAFQYALDVVLQRKKGMAYLAAGSGLVVIWAVLFTLDISEPQAYIIPLGISLIAVAWIQKRGARLALYRWFSIVGMVLLMGSLLIQSIVTEDGYLYAVLLFIECTLAIFIGARTHSRCYVQIGGLALIANALFQIAPGFVNLPRWIQIGLTGGILLSIGLLALFQRERLLKTRKKLTEDWRQWNP